MKFILIVAFLFGSQCFAKDETDKSKLREVVSEQIQGDPMVIESSSMMNWRAACRDFAVKPREGYIVEIDCGDPRCQPDTDDFEIVCTSSGRKAIQHEKPFAQE